LAKATRYSSQNRINGSIYGLYLVLHISRHPLREVTIPAGDATSSFNCPGCFLVSITIFAAPNTYQEM
jgi:hypothetical protein